MLRAMQHSLLEQRLLLYTAGKAGLRTVARHAEQQQVEMHALQFLNAAHAAHAVAEPVERAAGNGHLGLFQPREFARTRQSAREDQHRLIRHTACHSGCCTAGIQKHRGIRPQQRRRLLRNDLLFRRIARRTPAELVVRADDYLDRFDAAVHANHSSRLIECLQIGSQRHFGHRRKSLLQLYKAQAALSVDQFDDCIAALFHRLFPPISRAAESLPADIPLPPGTTGRCVRPQCQPAR